MSTNPRDVVARIEARIAGYEALLAKRPDCWPGDEFGKGGGAEYVSDLRTILSALQPAVSEEAVEVAARKIGDEVGLHMFDDMALGRAELRKLVRSADGYEVTEPTQTDCRLAARAALTAALPFMMGERT